MSASGERLIALREQTASRRGWGPRTVGRLTARRALSGAIEWVAVVFVSDTDDERKSRHAFAGIGSTDDEALEKLGARIQEGVEE